MLDQTVQFVKKVNDAGLSPSEWTIYDINLQEKVSFNKADQILNQCTNTQVAYFQPISLQIKTITEETQGKEPGMKEELILSVQGKFLARQP